MIPNIRLGTASRMQKTRTQLWKRMSIILNVGTLHRHGRSIRPQRADAALHARNLPSRGSGERVVLTVRTLLRVVPRQHLQCQTRCQPCRVHQVRSDIGLAWISRIYPLELARPKFGRRGEPSGTKERTAPNASEPSLPLSSSTHAYASMLSTQRSFVFGPADERRSFRSLGNGTTSAMLC